MADESQTRAMDIDVDEGATSNESPILGLDILSQIHEARNTYGLRHEDYQRYRQYCTRKLRRLRKALDLVQAKGRKFHKRELDPTVVDDSRHLEIVLVDCERAWALAMELKAYARDEPRKQYHLIRRLRKATLLAKHLSTLCNAQTGAVDVRTSLDAKAYAALLEGLLNVEVRAWRAGLANFTTARVIYEKMAQAGTPYQENLCQAMIDQIQPNIRLCSYHLRLREDNQERNEAAAAAELPELSQLQITSQTKGRSIEVGSIEWLGLTIPLATEQLDTAAKCAMEAEQAFRMPELSSSGEDALTNIPAAYASILDAYGQMERVARRLVKEDEAAIVKIRSSKSDEHSKELRLIHDFAVFRRVQHSIQRQVALAHAINRRAQLHSVDIASQGKIVKRADAIKALGDVLQYCEMMLRLSSVKDSAPLLQEVEAAQLFYQAMRCRMIAENYAANLQFVEMFAMLERAREKLGRARADKSEQGDNSLFAADVLSQEDSALRAAECRGRAQLAQHGAHLDKSLSQQLSELSVNDAPTQKRPSVPEPSFPPAIQPVPTKPVFFDMALNFIDYDADAIATRGGRKRAGLGGLLGGLWNR